MTKKTNVVVDQDGEVELTNEEAEELNTPIVTATLPTLKLTKTTADSNIEILAIAKTSLQATRLFDHILFRLEHNVNDKKAKGKAIESYVG